MKILYLAFLLLSSSAIAQTAWTNQSPAGLSDDIWSVTFANDTFVAVTAKGKVLTSLDGLSWSTQTVAPDWLLSVSFGNGLWVVVGDKGSVYYSADLRTWSAARAFTNQRLNGVAHTGNMFVAVGEAGVIATSRDAQTWTLKNSGTTVFLRGIAVNTANTGSYKMPTYANVITVVGGSGVILQSAATNTVNEGENWQIKFSGITDDIEAVAGTLTDNSSGTLVGVGGAGAVGYSNYTSYWGTTPPFAFSKVSPRTILRGLAHGAGVFVAAGEQGVIFTSSNGVNWTQRFSGDSPSSLHTGALFAVAYAETLQRFVAVGTNGAILISNAAPSTLINVSTRGTVINADPLIGGFVVNGTAMKYVLIRAIGPTLGSFGVSRPLSDPVIKVVDSRGLVVATNTKWSTNENLTALVAATARTTFPLGSNSADSALYLSLRPGSYTVQITSASGETGTALFEAYSP